jgi:hypothetical protein
MGQKFAAFDAQGNVTGYYDSVDSPVPPGLSNTIELSEAQWQTCIASQGWTVVNGMLIAPVPLTAAELAAQALVQTAQTALATGLSIVSTNTAALNGTYAVDPLSQMDIIAVETSLNAGKGFPGSVTTFSYPDVTGIMHAFTEANFTDLAAAVRDYVYALKSVIAGASTTLPATSTTIA